MERTATQTALLKPQLWHRIHPTGLCRSATDRHTTPDQTASEHEHVPDQPDRTPSIGRAVRRLPVTSLMLFVAGLLYSSTVYIEWFMPSLDLMFARPGAIRTLVVTAAPEVSGFFDLWRGEWWRITISAFHHGNLMHLLCNAVALWVLADMLEPKLTRMRYLAFCLLGATFSLIPELILGIGVIGLSGLAYAMFGLLLVLRRHDESVAERFQGSIVTMGFGCLFLCVPLSMVDGIAIANGAHFFGLLYGYAFGAILYDLGSRRRVLATGAIFTLHAALVGVVVLLTAPFWNGRYWAWRALQEEDPSHWIRATEQSPDLPIAWKVRIELARADGDLHEAWTLALKAVRMNRSDKELDGIARNLWRVFDGVERATALDELKDVFGKESDAWLRRLALSVPSGVPNVRLAEMLMPDLPPQGPISLNVVLEVPEHVPGITQPHPDARNPADVDPDHPRSARLGDLL